MSTESNDDIGDFLTELLSYVNQIGGLMPRIRNIEYNTNNNTTSIYGHTNFEELKVNNSPVALQSQIPDISTKANVSHTHNIDDVILTYEEEETNNEEETVTVNKTKTLSNILDTKANSSHTHTLSDISDYTAPDLSGYALTTHNHDSSYAPASHTHTISEITDYTAPDLSGYALTTHNHDSTYASLNHTHNTDDITYLFEEEEQFEEEEDINGEITTVSKTRTITRSVPLNDVLTDGKSIMTTNTNNIDTMATSVNTLASSIQDYIDTLDNNGTSVSGDTITFTANLGNNYVKKTELATSVTTNSLTVNGTITSTSTITGTNVLANNETRLTAAEGNITSLQNGKAALSHTHTLSEITDYTAYDDTNCAKTNTANTFTNSQTIQGDINQLDPYMSTYLYYYIGKAMDNIGGCANICYYYNGTLANRYIGLNLCGYNGLKIYYDKITTTQPIESTSTIIGTNVLANNETRLAACESGLTGKASSSHNHDGTYAKLSASNTFTNTNTFNDMVYLNDGLWVSGDTRILNENLNANWPWIYLYIGQTDEFTEDGTECGCLQYCWDSTNANRYFYVGLNTNAGGIKFFSGHVNCYDTFNCSQGITSTSTIVGTNVLANNETRLAACENGLTGKANSSHTHTLSEITDYTAPDLSNCAKLNQDNTFTLSNADLTTPELQIINTGKTSSRGVTFAIGNGTSTNNQFRIGYYPSESSTYIYCRGYNYMNFLYNSGSPYIRMVQPLTVTQKITCPSISLNGNDLQTMLDGKASTSHTHSGYASSSHTHSGYSGTFTAYKFETNYSTASNALGSNLQNAIFDLIYPVGSIYITYSQPSGCYAANSSEIRVDIHGCTFTLLPSNYFLRNVKWQCSSSSYQITSGAGNTGGSTTHTHTTGDHTLTIAEMPSHQHQQYVTEERSSGSEKVNVDYNRWTYAERTYHTQTSSTGGGQAHNHGNTGSADNIPPYIQVFMWRRIA